MNINTLTIKAQEALQAALDACAGAGTAGCRTAPSARVSSIREDDSLAAFLLGRVGVNVRSLRDETERAVGALPRVEGGGEQFFAQETSKAIQRAVDFTKNFGDKYASVEHLLLALVAERGAAADILKRNGATEKELIEADPDLPQGGDGRFADRRTAVRRAGQVRHQPERAGAFGQARPGDRP